ncbi:MBL fold metallo-hydrolase [Sulfuriroseicoccus oceanibius]|uniref:MBL fold metallo-hydrolase n=1 Tax=Sulfuriroseicoccus oceanibius TaxID=2707525 RepID=A0A6B3LE98_9BACT|nr:MBL fold metallo-hydrolase [Sulfuriroseicoccus oceanibius]QQL45662.1 MBL fold metallo-hydrolase [Sulfuriroseicoccus oceanibius]
MKFTNLSRGNEIGSNSYLLECGRTNIVLDSGMHPKRDGLDSTPDFPLLRDRMIDTIFVTHSHLDHVGTLPLLQKEHPEADVYMSPETIDLADALLHNSVNVMRSRAIEEEILEYPLFEHYDVEEESKLWLPARTRNRFSVGRDEDPVTAEFFDAGHILGSVGVRLEHDGKSLFYTGDVHFEDQTISMAADFPRDHVDTLVMETTRGASERRPDYTRSSEITRLIDAIEETLERGGAVLIPVFAMGKTQELLTILHGCKQRGLLRDAPLHMGGLSTKMTTIFDRHAATTRRKNKGFRILREVDLQMRRRRDRSPLRPQAGGIYALSSGMMTEKTTSNQFARGFLKNPKNSIIFVGYADPASPAGAILEADRGDQIQLDHRYPAEPLNCDVHRFDFSGHATREELVHFATDVRPKKVVLVHGDTPALDWFQQTLSRELPDSEILIPQPGQALEL